MEDTFQVALPGGGSLVYRSARADAVGRALYWRGLRGYEAETVAVFWALARRASLVVDVGANTGLFALLACAARGSSRVVAFEPVPANAAALRANLEANGWTGRCRVRLEAVAEGAGRARLAVPRGDLPHGASLEPQRRPWRHETSPLEVPTVSLDAAFPEPPGPDLVKIDVERAEDRVLAGMQVILERDRPVLIVECVPGGPNERVGASLAERGYRFYELREGPVPAASLSPDPARRWRNYLCLPEGRDPPPPVALP